MKETALLNVLADALDTASAVLREGARAISDQHPVSRPDGEDELLARARESVPLLGPRQAEILTLLFRAYPDGHDTGHLSRTMDYDQSDVYLTCNKLASKYGLVEKDTAVSPHMYSLSKQLMGDAAA